MVAYNFHPRFAPMIRDGLKRQTIRPPRKDERHARPGERLQLFTGMRGPDCRKICPDPVCTGQYHVEIVFGDGEITGIALDGVPVRALQIFAADEGFLDLDDMAQFFRETHGLGQNAVFRGTLVEWMPDPWEEVPA